MTADHDQIESLVAAFVLDACEDRERPIVEAHIEACMACRELTGRLRRACSALPLSTEAVQPPARLRARLLAAAAVRPPAPVPVAIPPRSVPRARRRRLPRIPLGRPRLRTSLLGGTVAAFAAVLAGLIGWNASLTQQLHQLNQPPPRYALAGSDELAGASGNVTALARYGYTLVDFSGLPQLPAGRVYELWLISPNGRALPAKVFSPDSHGSAQLVLTRTLQNVGTVAVTVEQGPDGVSAPTQHPRLAGRV